MNLTGIDIYCGCGGMSVGAQLGSPGLAIRYGLDYDKHACATFKRNHPEAHVDCADVANISAQNILDRGGIDSIDYLLTGPSCQAVSTMGLFYTEDSRNLLFTHLARLLAELKKLGKLPKNIVLENVPGIVYQKNLTLVKDLLRHFTELGYKTAADVVSVAALGVPQLRYRFFLFATRDDRPLLLPKPGFADPELNTDLPEYRTVGEAISDLFALPAQENDGAIAYPAGVEPTEYQNHLRSKSGRTYNHWASDTESINIERITPIPQGGSWKDIPADLLPKRFHKVRMTDYHTLYGRLHESNPAYTITASFGNVTSGCFTHPQQHRPITVREGCRLQGFPDDFVVTGPRNTQYRQVGNAVPPLAMATLISFWERAARSGSTDGVVPRISLAALEKGGTLPVFAPRYRGRKSEQKTEKQGYGSGTFWPKGWGEEPAELPKQAENYRKVDDPLVFRREAWRAKREEEDQDEYLECVRSLDASQLALSVSKKPYWVVSATHETKGATLFDTSGAESFYHRLSELTALVLAVRGPMVITTDFQYTADRLASFIDRVVRVEEHSLQIFRTLQEMPKKGRESVSVWVLSRSESRAGEDGPSFQKREDGKRWLHFTPFASSEKELPRRVHRWAGLIFSSVSRKAIANLLASEESESPEESATAM